jgi:hypothetical protein
MKKFVCVKIIFQFFNTKHTECNTSTRYMIMQYSYNSHNKPKCEYEIHIIETVLHLWPPILKSMPNQVYFRLCHVWSGLQPESIPGPTWLPDRYCRGCPRGTTKNRFLVACSGRVSSRGRRSEVDPRRGLFWLATVKRLPSPRASGTYRLSAVSEGGTDGRLFNTRTQRLH